MPMDLNLRLLPQPSVEWRDVEIVERKGRGHPDSLCDALAECFSLALCRFYRDRFGTIFHHNVDKVLLVGGEAQPVFGGGTVSKPIEIFLSGRATREVGGVAVPVEALALDACRRWLADHVRNLEPDRHVKLHVLVRPGSADLAELYLRRRKAGVWLANDTSCGVGLAPLSELETIVLAVERHLNAADVKARHPEIGEDVKIMAVRRGEQIRLTIACALVSRFVTDLQDYLAKKRRIAAIATEAAGRPVEVAVNTADEPAKQSLYLTVTGTSAEAGDDGEAGRGNRVNGLITPYRPMTMESVAGKNPLTHVGKLYNIAASLIAEALVREVAGIAAAECYLVSQIGRPIDQPQIIDVAIAPAEPRPAADFGRAVKRIVHDHLSRMGSYAEELLAGHLALDRWPLRGP
jgi:S-adenosylmethionine synthetase